MHEYLSGSNAQSMLLTWWSCVFLVLFYCTAKMYVHFIIICMLVLQCKYHNVRKIYFFKFLFIAFKFLAHITVYIRDIQVDSSKNPFRGMVLYLLCKLLSKPMTLSLGWYLFPWTMKDMLQTFSTTFSFVMRVYMHLTKTERRCQAKHDGTFSASVLYDF